MSEKELTFEEWQKTVHKTIRAEKFWSLIAYQKALYLYNLLWDDTEEWRKDERGQALSKQIIGSSDSICSNIEEGFGRGLGKQLVQFYIYSLAPPARQKDEFIGQRHFTHPRSSTSDLILPARSLP
jgi:hypothetical protein